MKNNRKKYRAKATNKRPTRSVHHPKELPTTVDKWLPFAIYTLFGLVIGSLLCTYNSDYLFRAQEMSLFLPTQLFWQEQMAVPGGLLGYIGCFFTQFFYYPWLGSLLLILLWIVISILTQKAFHIPHRWALLALIPSIALLAADTQLGYWIYYLKSPGYFFSHSLGYLTTLSAYWFFQLCRKVSLKALWILLWTGLGYPLFGFYALLASLFMAVSLWTQKEEKRNILTILTLFAIVFFPLIWYYHYTHIRIEDIYIAALPKPFEFSMRDISMWIPFLVLTIYPIVLLWLLRKKEEHPDSTPVLLKPYLFKQGVLLVVLVFTIQHFWYRDANYRSELAMHLAIEDSDWEGVLEEAEKTKDTPTRLMVMNKNLALFKLGRAGNEMYKYPDGGKAPNTNIPVHMIQMGGRMLYMHYGKENFCYRWCLEDAVEYGMKVDYLKFLIKTSIISGENELARKYIHTLKKTLFYKKEAERLEGLLTDSTLLAKDPEFSSILPMMCYNDVLDGDNALVELYLLYYFSHSDGETKEFQEQTLLSALQMKDIQLFWPRFFRYANLHQGEHMPTHYQEAALLYGTLEKTVDISNMPFDPIIKNRFNEFMRLVQQSNGKSEEEVAPFFKERYGDTFFYQYFFVHGVKSY